ncbi:hypothetical protein E2C01_096743 [Portunus trituberculatus]|uniref:Uncharacterized protein n=1 Tax=Portunus trituberculatus TaxID=210409 RepID=A0A5B7K9A2_PORTR|nr:hypothetical protein [Portunus trituberculatus]
MYEAMQTHEKSSSRRRKGIEKVKKKDENSRKAGVKTDKGEEEVDRMRRILWSREDVGKRS